MIDWQKIRREIHIFIAALLFALTLGGTLLFIHQQSYTQWQQASNQQRQASIRLQTASNQKLLLEQYQQRFNALKTGNVLGEEQRINWVETIQQSSTRHAIPSVKFTLDQRATATLPEDITGITVYISKMRLDMNLLHEGDLYNLFADLDSRAQGLYGIKSCTLKHEGTPTSGSEITSSLNGNCDLYWYTLDEIIEPQYDENGEPIAPDGMMQDGGEEI
ncbi:MAG: hypothetical protein QG652_56 [Pseudomonadota bacterium]|nr:hypothetical protein [Pseudomonadota bacterium]